MYVCYSLTVHSVTVSLQILGPWFHCASYEWWYYYHLYPWKYDNLGIHNTILLFLQSTNLIPCQMYDILYMSLYEFLRPLYNKLDFWLPEKQKYISQWLEKMVDVANVIQIKAHICKFHQKVRWILRFQEISFLVSQYTWFKHVEKYKACRLWTFKSCLQPCEWCLRESFAHYSYIFGVN